MCVLKMSSRTCRGIVTMETEMEMMLELSHTECIAIAGRILMYFAQRRMQNELCCQL